MGTRVQREKFLRDFVPTILPWLDSSGTEDERRRVLSSMAWLERVQAGGLPMDGLGLPPLEGTDVTEEETGGGQFTAA